MDPAFLRSSRLYQAQLQGRVGWFYNVSDELEVPGSTGVPRGFYTRRLQVGPVCAPENSRVVSAEFQRRVGGYCNVSDELTVLGSTGVPRKFYSRSLQVGRICVVSCVSPYNVSDEPEVPVTTEVLGGFYDRIL